MTNEEMAGKIWDEVFAYQVVAADPGKQEMANVSAMVVRHEMIQQIAHVLERYS